MTDKDYQTDYQCITIKYHLYIIWEIKGRLVTLVQFLGDEVN